MAALATARQLRGVRGCGATLMGERVTGVRVTPISGLFGCRVRCGG